MADMHKLRMTLQRRVILEELRKARTHPTADELYEVVRRRLPRISLGTVYRNLDALCRCGLIQKLELSGSQRRFDADLRPHYHVRCVRCGRVDDAPIEPLQGLDEAAQAACDYEIFGHRLKFLGICPECRRKEAEGDGRGRC